MSSFGCRWRSEERMWFMVYFVPLTHENWPCLGNTATPFFLYGQIFGPIGDLPCLPEAFHARFPVSVKMCRPSACGRRSSSWHAEYYWSTIPTGMKQGLSCEHLQMKFMTLHSFHAILRPTRSRMKAWHTNWLADFMSGGSDPKTTTP